MTTTTVVGQRHHSAHQPEHQQELELGTTRSRRRTALQHQRPKQRQCTGRRFQHHRNFAGQHHLRRRMDIRSNRATCISSTPPASATATWCGISPDWIVATGDDFEVVLRVAQNAQPGTVLVNTAEVTHLPGEDTYDDNMSTLDGDALRPRSEPARVKVGRLARRPGWSCLVLVPRGKRGRRAHRAGRGHGHLSRVDDDGRQRQYGLEPRRGL